MKSIFASYSQIFFSESRILAVIIIFITFFDPFAGLCGLVAVTVSLLTARYTGFDKSKIINGWYSFNSLLVGLGIGSHFEASIFAVVVVIFTSILCVFVSVALEYIIGKYYLPYMSVPFLVAVWVILLAAKNFHELQPSSRGIFLINDFYRVGGKLFVDLYYLWSQTEIISSLRIYFGSLGAIFFQYSILAGVFIAVGLLIFSRIAFTLSFLGFYTAYLFHYLAGIDMTEAGYSYIGFNYILTAIAIGGYFVYPSKSSYLWVIIIIPVTVIITVGLNSIFILWRLPVYSLPFNLIVLLFVYALKFRTDKSKGIKEVYYQQSTPEKNLYSFVNNNYRFRNHTYFALRLPFFGQWSVSQAHDGKITHKNKWRHAWDFVIKDELNHTFKHFGNKLEDYYCYNRAVLAPADGFVEVIVDGIPDNKVSDVNTEQNWGNTIILKHGEKFYTQLSHLKPGSFKVKYGDWVTSGQIIALCGSSGRSPEPHLHFQIQSIPVVGAQTLDYPLGHYIMKTNGSSVLKSYSKPLENNIIENLEIDSLMYNAFHFIPQQKLRFEVETGNKKEFVDWEIHTDIYNLSYIECKQTKSYSYFSNLNGIFYFYNFIGNKKSLLYYFFLAAYKVPLGFYENLQVRDAYAINMLFNKMSLWIQDFIAPFFMFLKAGYGYESSFLDNKISPSLIRFTSFVQTSLFNKVLKKIDFRVELDREGIKNIEIITNNKTIKAKCIIN